MMKLINFIKSRPSDQTIKLLRIWVGLILTALLGLGYLTYEVLPSLIPAGIAQDAVKLSLIFLALLPVLWGIADLPLGKKKAVSYAISLFGLFWLIVGNLMIPVVPDTSAHLTSLSSFASITDQNSASSIDLGFYIALIGLVVLVVGWTGKFITTRHLKYGEKITKIRV